jgi:hypothetical protein
MEGGCAPRFLKRCRLSTARVLINPGRHGASGTSYQSVQRRDLGAGVACRLPSGRPTPPSGPPAALEAYKVIASFCQKHLPLKPRPMNAALLTHTQVKTSW